eukprot:8369018-Alexandrium_andersonii.AAC.1
MIVFGRACTGSRARLPHADEVNATLVKLRLQKRGPTLDPQAVGLLPTLAACAITERADIETGT